MRVLEQLGGTLPPIIWIVLLLAAAWLFADLLVLIPLECIRNPVYQAGLASCQSG